MNSETGKEMIRNGDNRDNLGITATEDKNKKRTLIDQIYRRSKHMQ